MKRCRAISVTIFTHQKRQGIHKGNKNCIYEIPRRKLINFANPARNKCSFICTEHVIKIMYENLFVNKVLFFLFNHASTNVLRLLHEGLPIIFALSSYWTEFLNGFSMSHFLHQVDFNHGNILHIVQSTSLYPQWTMFEFMRDI